MLLFGRLEFLGERADASMRPSASQGRRANVGNFLAALAAIILSSYIIVLSAASPAAAITADLAKKCRDMAVKAHPPPNPPGNRAYAQAERDFFRECVSKNGEMQSTAPPKDSTGPN
jgi:hypothetical protein